MHESAEALFRKCLFKLLRKNILKIIFRNLARQNKIVHYGPR